MIEYGVSVLWGETHRAVQNLEVFFAFDPLAKGICIYENLMG